MTIYSGNITSTITWSLNTYTKILYISGTGAMEDYEDEADQPWFAYSSDIEHIVISDGITHIGAYTFNFTAAKTVDMGNTVETIGTDAFSQTALERITIPDSVTAISDSFFNLNSLKEIIIGSNVSNIAGGAFVECHNVDLVTFMGTTAPTMGNQSFSLGDQSQSCTALIRTSGWGNDSVFTSAVRGAYTTFTYETISPIEYEKLRYGGKKVQVESAIRDEDGVRIKTNYAKKSEVSVQFTDVSIAFTLQSTPDYEDYPYRGSFASSMITANTYASVTYSDEQATSLNFSPFCDTDAGMLYIYSRTDVGTQVIPTINLGGGPTEIAIDSTPTSGSGNAVSSGGVYTALGNYVTLGTDQSITGRKTIYSTTTAELPIQTAITSEGDIGGIGYYDGDGGRIIKTWGTTTGKYTIELLEGSQKSAQVINQRSYASANTNDIVTIGTYESVANNNLNKYTTYSGDSNNWLDVDLSNATSPKNRIRFFDNSASNVPKSPEDPYYCWFGTRYVQFQANNFVTVLAVGQDNSSQPGVWINNYNQNAGGWVGWKRLHSRADYVWKSAGTNPSVLANATEIMLVGKWTENNGAFYASTIYPGKATTSTIYLSICYTNSRYATIGITNQSIFTYSSSGNWDDFYVYYR